MPQTPFNGVFCMHMNRPPPPTSRVCWPRAARQRCECTVWRAMRCRRSSTRCRKVSSESAAGSIWEVLDKKARIDCLFMLHHLKPRYENLAPLALQLQFDALRYIRIPGHSQNACFKRTLPVKSIVSRAPAGHRGHTADCPTRQRACGARWPPESGKSCAHVCAAVVW